MIKILRIATTTLFVMSMFCLASCNRNRCDSFSSPCGVNCPPSCGTTCPTPCAQPVSCVSGNDTPISYGSCNTAGGSAPLPPAGTCPTCQKGCQKGQGGSNPYYPCDSNFFPCGGNGSNNSGTTGSGCSSCNAGPAPSICDRCYGNMQTSSMCDECLVEMSQVAPGFATVGSPFPISITIKARKECAAVKIDQLLPCDSVFICSEPATTPDANNHVTWEFPHMVAGECRTLTIWVKPQSEGCCVSEATICACPQLCTYTKCGQPVVCIQKCGPACACLYCPLAYTITVSNSGSATAYDVVVTDTVPEGLAHSSGYNFLTYELGDLCPGQTRTINLELCATRAGTVTNTACVTYCGGPKCCAEATTIINKPCVEVTKCGADWAYICKTVDYTITVSNPGDLVLRNVVVDDVTGAGTVVCEAPGAQVCCNRATWCIPELCPGQSQTFVVTVRSQVAGCIPNKVTVTSQSDCGPCTKSAEVTTCWKGLPAVHMCMVDTCDPICLGDTTVYRICVTNRGTADDTNVQLSLTFTNELQPQTINGPTQGSINGQTVTFAPIERLAPKQSVEYCITVKGVATGNARADATLSSDGLGEPDHDQESTHVY